MKINLGCGTRYIDGWINIDWSTKYKVDYSLDIGNAKIPIDDSSADEVISSHLIEHLTRLEGLHHLKEIYRVLSPGGVLIISWPDINKIINVFLGNDSSMKQLKNNHDWLIQAIFETQTDNTIIHKYGYTAQTMTNLLKKIGFKDLQHITNPIDINGERICDYRYAITILKATK